MSRPPTPTQQAPVSLLADPTRRRICSILTDPDPPVSERDLAVELAIRSLDLPASEISASQRREKEVQLHHHQLPKLADYGLVTYDRSTKTVSITAAGCETLAAATEHPSDTPSAALTSPTEH